MRDATYVRFSPPFSPLSRVTGRQKWPASCLSLLLAGCPGGPQLLGLASTHHGTYSIVPSRTRQTVISKAER